MQPPPSVRIEQGTLTGDTEVRDHLAMYGLALGDLHVLSGGTLDLYGLCQRNLVVQPGAVVRIFGLVNGDVMNNGGSVHVLGTVQGLVTNNRGTVRVEPNAVVAKGVQASGDNSQAVGLIGGAALGAAIGGPVGAVVGGIIGAVLGKESKGLG